MSESTTLLVLGAGGDLTARLLLPALGQLLTIEPERRVRLLGVGIESYSPDAWRERVREAFRAGDASGDAVEALLETTEFLTADVSSPDALRKALDAAGAPTAIYFALPPAVTLAACKALERTGVQAGTVLAIEKPFGTDEASASALNELLLRIVPERQIHRVDHFLGRTTVLNLLGVRFANRVFEPIWNAEHIQRVDIIYDEDLALENRAGYYDRAGALVDMIQSHLLQVLALFAMEPPSTIGEADLRDAKGLVLRATRPWRDDPAASSRRARYTAGRIGDRELPGYLDEAGVDAANDTETLAEVDLEVATWRWSGVPFTLRSGKAIGRKRREIMVTFREAARVPAGLEGASPANVLHLALVPDRMSLEVNMNGPGDPNTISREVLEAELDPGRLRAYGEVLSGILDGDPSLSIRGDTAEQCWRIVDPVLNAWRSGEVPMHDYAAGSVGPDAWRTSHDIGLKPISEPPEQPAATKG